MQRTAVLALVALLGLGTATAAPAKHRRLAPRHHASRHRPITRPTWLHGVKVTEYYAVPEAWYSGQRVAAPGLAEPHRIDWLYSASGIVLEGDGVDLQGHAVHLATADGRGFVDASGHRTRSSPAWVSGGYWLSSAHALTFPLEAGGWSAGIGIRFRSPPPRLTFAPGPSRPLTPEHSLAVDPRLIPLGSRVYIPAYVGLDGSNGWFVAEDTGGAIRGRRVDVYRVAPPTRDAARMLTAQRILVEPPGTAMTMPAGGTAVPASISCGSTLQEVPCPTS